MPSNPTVAPGTKLCQKGLHRYDALENQCPICKRDYVREWRKNNKEKMRSLSRKYYYADRDKFRKKAREWRIANRDEITARERKRYQERREEYRAVSNAWRAKNRELATWISMRNRCEDTKDRQYKWYGARGITVCDRWKGRGGYRRFLQDMGRRPSDHHTLDRINNDGNYEANNCRWATMLEQQRNKSNNVLVTFNGRTQCIAAWADELGIRYGTLATRIRKWGAIDRAFTQGVR